MWSDCVGAYVLRTWKKCGRILLRRWAVEHGRRPMGERHSDEPLPWRPNKNRLGAATADRHVDRRVHLRRGEAPFHGDILRGTFTYNYKVGQASRLPIKLTLPDSSYR